MDLEFAGRYLHRARDHLRFLALRNTVNPLISSHYSGSVVTKVSRVKWSITSNVDPALVSVGRDVALRIKEEERDS